MITFDEVLQNKKLSELRRDEEEDLVKILSNP